VSDDYGYLNARVRGMKGRLLPAEAWRSALETASLAEFAAFLGTTPYAAAVGEAMTVRKDIGGVEEGLRTDFQRTADHLLHMASGRARELLAIVLGRWEIFNVKTVLRGRHAGSGIDSVLGSTIPFGRLDGVALKELARQESARAIVALLAQWRIPYAATLREALPAYLEHGDLAVLEVALDHAFFATALRGLDPGERDDAAVADYLRREIDLILLGYALRAMHHGTAEAHCAENFIPGGRTVTLPVLERLCAARTLREYLDAVPPSPYAACLAEGLQRYLATHRLFALDRLLQTCFVREMLRFVGRDPLTIAFMIGYLWHKASEITNLRLIARGKYAAVPRDEIEALMLPAG
jgi:V/A-type H+-transporting ATPase subunit C